MAELAIPALFALQATKVKASNFISDNRPVYLL
jgi:hypothetical protein